MKDQYGNKITEQECDKKWRLKIEEMKRDLSEEFKKAVGIDRYYDSVIYNSALDDLLNNK